MPKWQFGEFLVKNFLWEKNFDIPLVWGGSWNLWLQDIDPWRGAIRILQDARAEANLSLNLGCYMKYSQSREHNMIQDWNHPCCWSLRFIFVPVAWTMRALLKNRGWDFGNHLCEAIQLNIVAYGVMLLKWFCLLIYFFFEKLMFWSLWDFSDRNSMSAVRRVLWCHVF